MANRAGRAAAVGLATALAGVLLTLVPSISALEDTLGLRFLFLARGDLAPPAGVAVVSIDDAAAARMGLPPRVRDWPRATHAGLVRQLMDRGASAIAFDIEFLRNGPPADDEEFASAIRESRRVVLAERFNVYPTAGSSLWVRQRPVPVLAAGAAGVAAVPLPDGPIVSWFWSFLDTPQTGEVPTLASVALQVHAIPVTRALAAALVQSGRDGLASLPLDALDQGGPGELLQVMRTLRQVLREQPAIFSRAAERLQQSGAVAPGQMSLVHALGALYTGPNVGDLNFYGQPGTICTIPYDVAYAASGQPWPCPVSGATVFVGVGRSRLPGAEQQDTYHTVYENKDGVDLSGVEIHATAFANLLHRTVLRPLTPGWTLVTILAFGGALGAGGYWARTRRRRMKGAVPARLQAALVVGTIAAAYVAVGYVLFLRVHVLLPLVVPIVVQLPAALILVLLARPVVHEESLPAVCLAVDASGSTALGQRLPHSDYARLMRDYNQHLSLPVVAHGGRPLPPQGDGFVAVWFLPKDGDSQADDAAPRYAACRCALAIGEAADGFNRRLPEDQRLPVRMGLTVGSVTVRSDADRGAFDVVGDAVNVAARLQDLNHQLATRVLAADTVVHGHEATLRVRPIATRFELKGLAHSPTVCELIGLVHGAPSNTDR